jgi:hypothetical protein
MKVPAITAMVTSHLLTGSGVEESALFIIRI